MKWDVERDILIWLVNTAYKCEKNTENQSSTKKKECTVKVRVKDEVIASKKIISELQDYKNKYWAIGLNGDTLQPDHFLKFFKDRDLPFHYFVRTNLVLGSKNAYEKNIQTLQQHIQAIFAHEKQQCQKLMKDFQDYKDRYWAIGLNGDTLQPDHFVEFFCTRKLHFHYFVRSRISQGDYSAYEKNITTLQQYLQEMKELIS